MKMRTLLIFVALLVTAIVARPRKFLVNKHGNWKVVQTHTKGKAIKEHGHDYSDTKEPAAKGKKKQKEYGTEEAVDTKAPAKKEKGNGTEEPVGDTEETTKKEGPVVDTTKETKKKGKGYGGEEPIEDTEETTKKEGPMVDTTEETTKKGYGSEEPVGDTEESTKKEEVSGTEEQSNTEDPQDVTDGEGEEEGSGTLLLPEETNKETEDGTTTETPEEENNNESTATNDKSSTTETTPDDGGGATLKIKPEPEGNIDLKIKPEAEIKPVNVPLSSGVKEGKYEETVEEIEPENGEENDNTGGGEYSPNEANPTDANLGDEETSEQSESNGNDYSLWQCGPEPELCNRNGPKPAGYVQNQGPKNRATINNQWGPKNVFNERTHNEINQKHFGTGDQEAGIGCGGNDYWGGNTVVNNQWGPTNVHNKETTNIINQEHHGQGNQRAHICPNNKRKRFRRRKH